jgi:hypothetical protein
LRRRTEVCHACFLPYCLCAGVLKFATLGFFFIGHLVDVILIATQTLGPADNSSYVINYFGAGKEIFQTFCSGVYLNMSIFYSVRRIIAFIPIVKNAILQAAYKIPTE